MTKVTQVVEDRYLVQKDFTVLTLSTPNNVIDLQITTRDLIKTLGVERARAIDSADGSVKPSPKIPDSERGIAERLARFIELSYLDLVAIICKGDKKSLGTTTHATIVALATWLCGHLAVDEKLSIPAAITILVAITRATKGGFCKMAAEDAKRAIAARTK